MKNRVKHNLISLEEFEQRCREQGMPVTAQRRVVLEELLRHDDHPTADQVLEGVRGRMPEISRATVYRVLETLVRLGAAQKTCHPGGVARFDPKTERHHHLVCTHCGKVVDVEDTEVDVPLAVKTRRGG